MSCLFDALSRRLVNCSSKRLRQLLAHFERRNPVMPNGMSFAENIAPTTLESYYRWISNESSWGGALEIAAFCQLFRVRVEVVTVPSNKTIQFQPFPMRRDEPPPARTVRLVWNGYHYWAM